MAGLIVEIASLWAGYNCLRSLQYEKNCKLVSDAQVARISLIEKESLIQVGNNHPNEPKTIWAFPLTHSRQFHKYVVQLFSSILARIFRCVLGQYLTTSRNAYHLP